MAVDSVSADKALRAGVQGGATPKSRVEAFSDCIIAFAITLLILDIHLQDVGTNVDNAAMIHALLALVPRFSIYVISFLICTVAWVSHHELIHDLDYVDPRLLWLNSLYLMWIGLRFQRLTLFADSPIIKATPRRFERRRPAGRRASS
jgi:hypothetical protein